MRHDKENDAILRVASRVSKGALGLCSGATIGVDWLRAEEIAATYYVSVVQESKSVLIGKAPTLHVVETIINDIAAARSAARRLSEQWNYEIVERV